MWWVWTHSCIFSFSTLLKESPEKWTAKSEIFPVRNCLFGLRGEPSGKTMFPHCAPGFDFKLHLLIRRFTNSVNWLPLSRASLELNDAAHRPSRSLRSMVANLLILPKCRTKTYGERAFAVAGPTLWNSLPQPMRELTSVNQFKAHLKTYLFDK